MQENIHMPRNAKRTENRQNRNTEWRKNRNKKGKKFIEMSRFWRNFISHHIWSPTLLVGPLESRRESITLFLSVGLPILMHTQTKYGNTKHLNYIQYWGFEIKLVDLSQFWEKSNMEDGPFTLDLDSLTLTLINTWYVENCLVNKMKRKAKHPLCPKYIFCFIMFPDVINQRRARFVNRCIYGVIQEKRSVIWEVVVSATMTNIS
jgi:hypothetical protein